MSVNIIKLKEILTETIVKDYIAEGFSFNKSQFSFSKKIKKDKISSMILFYDYSPFKVEYHFSFSFWIQEIETEIKKFYSFRGENYKNQFTLLLREGDFHPKVKDEILKFRGAYTHILTDFDDLSTIEESRKVLKEEFFPRLNTFSNLNDFQEYLFGNFKKVIDFNMILPSLIAVKLKSHNDFIELIKYLTKELQLDTKNDSHLQKKLIIDILAWDGSG